MGRRTGAERSLPGLKTFRAKQPRTEPPTSGLEEPTGKVHWPFLTYPKQFYSSTQ